MIAIVGSKDVYLGFKALGVIVADARTAAEAEAQLLELARRGCTLIYLSEPLVQENPALLEHFRHEATPVLAVIPDHRGSSGQAQRRIRALVERAVGIDLEKKT